MREGGEGAEKEVLRHEDGGGNERREDVSLWEEDEQDSDSVEVHGIEEEREKRSPCVNDFELDLSSAPCA